METEHRRPELHECGADKSTGETDAAATECTHATNGQRNNKRRNKREGERQMFRRQRRKSREKDQTSAFRRLEHRN